MGLINGSLQIGSSALLAHQAAMQVIGNNIANAGNTDFTRQTPIMTSTRGAMLPQGFDSGAGVQLTGIERQIDTALEQRLRSATSDKSHDDFISTTLGRLQSLYPDLTEEGLSTKLNDFFDAFSKLQATPQDESIRSTVIQEGQSLAEQIQTLRDDIIDIYNDVGETMGQTVDQINSITGQIADLNVQIANAKSGGDTAGALMDKRDGLLKQLSELTDINVIEQDNGQVTVYIDSDPLIQGNEARTLEVRKTTQGDIVQPEVIFSDNSRKPNITGGTAGAVNELLNTLINGNLHQLDTLASGLIYEVNLVHSSGQGLHGYSEITSTNATVDPTDALNAAGLDYTPKNGSFLITVTDKNTGQQTVSQINVNLSGLGTQATLNNLAAQINLTPNLSATVLADGRLKVSSANNNSTFTFSEDNSGVLAGLGINSFFTGNGAANIDVNSDLVADPQLVACAKNNLPGDGTNAADISQLRTTSADSLNGLSITDYYRSIISDVGTRTAAATQNLNIHSSIVDTLQAQRESISGVSLDEETINLMSNQQAFAGAARFITVINSMLQEVMKLI
ncbi:MAG: flagellar hook-associated protein FlgK [Phycisphaerae bacterium]